MENRTARLTVLIDPRKKGVFERLCADEDTTPSQVVRRLIRGFIEQRTGLPWNPADDTLALQPKKSSARRRPGRPKRTR
ncbi:MAG: CopG family transcriptional regulator [Burkholderiaceae bacterium]